MVAPKAAVAHAHPDTLKSSSAGILTQPCSYAHLPAEHRRDSVFGTHTEL